MMFGYCLLRRPLLIIATMALLAAAIGCSEKKTLFRKINPAHSGILFHNSIIENDSVNPIDLEFLYNGGGVAAGDFNGDGLTDLYFTGSTVENKLYLNRGELKFEDITDRAGVAGANRWANAASVVDINGDGLDDIYVCNTILSDAEQRRNFLFINTGQDKEGIPVFKEMAKDYGLDENGYSVQAAFFDYDNDGDLDMYLVNTKLAKREGAVFMNSNTGDTSTLDVDKLYRNDWSDSLEHPVFTDVSVKAGVHHTGFGLGVAIADINQDGWKDIYVTNDFFGSDQLYINNGNGSFTNRVRDYFRHTSQNAMGNDVADINNDGLPDILVVDMNPEDNFRKKKNMSGNNYYIYQNMMYGNGSIQYVRNTLQINQGFSVKENDSLDHPVFSEQGFLAGVAETDWSWSPSIADFNNDGLRDIIITNGYPRDVTDHDFSVFMKKSTAATPKQEIIDQIPIIKINNYAFVNDGDLHFRKVTSDWGLDQPSFSNGAIYADLDNDGDLDFVINNINDEAFLYENTLNTPGHVSKNFLSVRFAGPGKNTNGIGAIAELYYDGKKQVYENSPYRGYLSTVEPTAFFGLDSIRSIDSLVVKWNGNYQQVIRTVPINTRVIIRYDEGEVVPFETPKRMTENIFTDISSATAINYFHREPDFIDFNEQRLLPHKLSEYGPGLASGDLDGNGLDDIVIGGTGDITARVYFQQKDGKFSSFELPHETGPNARRPESLGVLVFDADMDGDLDIYFASGSNEFVANTPNYRDRLYVNNGKGNFTIDSVALPENFTSKGCIKAADFDNDGDLDLFIGGRVLPGKYPSPVSSFIYRNNSTDGKPVFEDATAEVAAGLQNIGMICDGIWTDFDNDGWIDLIIAGEWMPIKFFRNNKGRLEDVSDASGINSLTGWWNSIAAADIDNDGDMDYIIGNLGLNSFYKATDERPLRLYAADVDKNGTLDLMTTVYLPGENGKLSEYPAQTRDDHVDQVPALKKRFLTYKSFANAGMDDIFEVKDRKDALVLTANTMSSGLLRNNGGGKFEFIALPRQAQSAPVYGIIADDFNGDGYIDIALSGNDFGTEVGNGRYDGLDGLVLTGDGTFNFKPLTITESGLYIPGNGKALIRLRGAQADEYLVAASQNKGPLKIFRKKTLSILRAVTANDRFAEVSLKNGGTRRQEIYHGDSFLSQSALFILSSDMITAIEVTDRHGRKRKLAP